MSLGWLTESSLIPRDPKPIKGVSSASLISLQAAVYEREQRGPVISAKRRRLRAEASARNDGVEARRVKDELQATGAEATLDQVSAKLQLKAERYNAMVAGLASAGGESLVDFRRKREDEGIVTECPSDGEEEEPAAPARASVALPPPACLSVGVLSSLAGPPSSGFTMPPPPTGQPPCLASQASSFGATQVELCTSCGQTLSLDAVFCFRCGAKVECDGGRYPLEAGYVDCPATPPCLDAGVPPPCSANFPSDAGSIGGPRDNWESLGPMRSAFDRPSTSAEDLAHQDRLHHRTEQCRETTGQERRQAREGVRQRLAALRAAKESSVPPA